MALGIAEPQARKNVANAGSGPERPSQEDVIRWIAHRVLKMRSKAARGSGGGLAHRALGSDRTNDTKR